MLSLLLLLTAINNNCFSQASVLARQESRCAGLYSKILQYQHSDSAVIYANLFEKEFYKLVATNSASFSYSFPQLVDSGFCFIRVSPDKKLKIYSWDIWLGGTMHEFRTIYQWGQNGVVYCKKRPVNGDIGSFCSKIYSVTVAGQPHYLVITNAIFSTKDASQTVTAFTVNGNKLENKAAIFHTKTKHLSTISIEFDFFSVVDRPERPLELIVYDDTKKSLFIPVVDLKGQVTSKHLVYQLKEKGLVYTGIQ